MSQQLSTGLNNARIKVYDELKWRHGKKEGITLDELTEKVYGRITPKKKEDTRRCIYYWKRRYDKKTGKVRGELEIHSLSIRKILKNGEWGKIRTYTQPDESMDFDHLSTNKVHIAESAENEARRLRVIAIERREIETKMEGKKEEQRNDEKETIGG